MAGEGSGPVGGVCVSPEAEGQGSEIATPREPRTNFGNGQGEWELRLAWGDGVFWATRCEIRGREAA